MAIYKRTGKTTSFQMKIRGSDGRWITQTFKSEKEARSAEATLVATILSRQRVTNSDRTVTVGYYWSIWSKDIQGEVTNGWHQSQERMYTQYIEPILSRVKLKDVTPAHIKKILQNARDLGRAPQTCMHIFNLLHKMFKNAVEDYELIVSNPVRKRLKPIIPVKETAHLKINEIKKLLLYVRGKPYELAVWFGVYVGLRVGEVQALRWSNIDFENGLVHIRSTYARKEGVFRDYPKGRKWHSPVLPKELLNILKTARLSSNNEFVCPSPERPMLSYNGYLKALKRYCNEAGVTIVATHGLRHSTASLYLSHGATRDDLRELFAHSSARVTDRYVHEKSERLERVANVIELFPTGSEQ